jgi:hypothetical protein
MRESFILTHHFNIVKINTYIPTRQHVSATRSQHQASNIRTYLYLVFGVRLGSKLFTLLGYCCIQCSDLVKNKVKMEDKGVLC